MSSASGVTWTGSAYSRCPPDQSCPSSVLSDEAENSSQTLLGMRRDAPSQPIWPFIYSGISAHLAIVSEPSPANLISF